MQQTYNYRPAEPKDVHEETEGDNAAHAECGCEGHDNGAVDVNVTSKDGEGEAAGDNGAPAADPLGECEDRLKRAMADLENMRRREERDVSSRVASAVDPVMAELVDIRDDLARARDAATGPDATGLEGILKNTDALLAKNGVTEIDATGERFDPLMHEAVRVVEDSTLEDGTVVSVSRKGYICHGRVLRPSLVAVSRRVE